MTSRVLEQAIRETQARGALIAKMRRLSAFQRETLLYVLEPLAIVMADEPVEADDD